MVITWLAVLGLGLGSFINALVWRLHEGKPIINDRSMCVHCRHKLAWYDLVPVFSWLTLKGKCRYCRKNISWQYPMVELVTAALFVLSYLNWPRDLAGGLEYTYFGLWLVALIIMTALAVYDSRWMLLPDKLNWPFVLTGVVSVAVIGHQSVDLTTSHLLGAAAAWTFFALIYFGSKGKWLGGGDVKFALGMGAWLGWSNTIVGILSAFYSASLIILPLLLIKVVKRRQPIPFGPFLILGTFIAMLYGQDLIDWYSGLFLYGSF